MSKLVRAKEKISKEELMKRYPEQQGVPVKEEKKKVGLKLWEALKISEETGCKIRPTGTRLGFDTAKWWLKYGETCSDSALDYDWELEPEPEKSVSITRRQLTDLIADCFLKMFDHKRPSPSASP